MNSRDLNQWGVSYSMIIFFERLLYNHNKVENFERSQDILFKIYRKDGTVMNVLLVDEYTLGLAAILRALEEFPEIDYIVTGANWNGYTREAKEYGSENGIGVFMLSEFLGSLNWTNPKEYVQKDEDGNPIYHFKNT